MRKSITPIRDPLRWKQNVYNQGVEVVSLHREMLSFHCESFLLPLIPEWPLPGEVSHAEQNMLWNNSCIAKRKKRGKNPKYIELPIISIEKIA